ncbi:adenylyltransferase/cytidyltransferase family protein [Candidatus Woesearchaeota archaeon]|nr:adenylyltransferase/cytidyltransferase family protein [Candidatus Woesearchaeota archaeon]
MKVLAFGTFDIFHPGHEHFLKFAASHGSLHVVVARDSTVLNVKGNRPLNTEDARLGVISALPYVDAAVLGSTGDKYAIVEEIEPDYIILGYDQKAFVDRLSEELAKRGLDPKIIRAESYMPEKWKSSKLRQD